MAETVECDILREFKDSVEGDECLFTHDEIEIIKGALADLPDDHTWPDDIPEMEKYDHFLWNIATELPTWDGFWNLTNYVHREMQGRYGTNKVGEEWDLFSELCYKAEKRFYDQMETFLVDN